jgi:AraC family transcriptional regulator
MDAMSLTGKVLWTIERNLDQPLTLEEIAVTCGVSKYHLAHAFGIGTGHAVMQYLRSRRLTIAADKLAAGAPDILSLAIDAGYGSHEAFSRAFRAQFGVTPESVRYNRSTKDLTMISPIQARDSGHIALDQPRMVAGKPMIVIGLAERQSFETQHNIPGQWQRFMSSYDEIPDKVNPIPLGVSTDVDHDGNFNYVCGVEVSRVTHRDHVASISATYSAILDHWLPDHGRTAADGACLERHLETFDPRTGLGGVDIWIPLCDPA